ncbi:MAG TPA: MoaD/ThiS family protein [Planctomycetota bacterium]|nr:MoaD/ThiS family protein [Planctomycetota bacterium]
MKVRLPSPLYSYTGERAEVDAQGATLAEVLADLERRFPGLRFRIVDEQDRIRPHIKFFVGRELATDLAWPVRPSDEVMIVAALSGG